MNQFFSKQAYKVKKILLRHFLFLLKYKVKELSV